MQIWFKKRMIGRKEREESNQNFPNEDEVSSTVLFLCDSD